MSLESIVALIGGWSVILVGVSAWLGRLMTERLLYQWRVDEQTRAERLSDTLALNRMMLETASSILTSSQSTTMERRLKAIDTLWTSVLALKKAYSTVVFFYDILQPSEYDSALTKHGPMAASIASLTDVSAMDPIEPTGAVEVERPHLGEVLWLLFFVYRAFLGRLAFNLARAKAKGHIPDWREDNGLQEILSGALPKDDLALINKSSGHLNTLNRILQSLESRILREASLITSGRYSSLETLENARQLQDLASSLTPHGS